VKYNVPKNCAVGWNNFDSDSGSFADRKLGRQHFSSSPRVARNIRHRRFFPKQKEKMDSIEQVIDATVQAFLLELLHLRQGTV
jgi:hypothetical protein